MARFLSLTLLALACSMLLSAAEIHGIAVDPKGAPIEGVSVLLATSSQVAVAAATTDAQGRFTLPNLSPGSYLLTAAKKGFADFRAAIPLNNAEPKQVTIEFHVQAMRTAVTVSAESSQALAVDQSVQPVTLIPSEALHDRAVVLSDAAEGEPGVHQLRTSPTLGSFFVRGLTGNKVAVYRDGVRYTNASQRGGISTFLNLIQPEAVDSVEVLRGPNSAQYGSDSLGGTVSILSKAVVTGVDPGVWHGELAPSFQSTSNGFGSSAALNYGGPRFGFHSDLIAHRANTLRTGGGVDSHAAVTRFLGLPSTIFGERLPDTAFTSYGGSFHGQIRVSNASQLVVHYERSQQDGGKRYDQLLGGDGNLIADLRNLMLDFGYLRYQHFRAGPFDHFALSGSYNAQREERVNQGGQGNPAAAITYQYEKTKVAGVQLLLDKRFRRLDWAIGAEAYRETAAAPSFSRSPETNAISIVRPRIPDGAQYYSHGVYTQGTWQPTASERFRVSGALRFGGASYNSRAARSPLVGGRPLWPDDSLSANALTGRIGTVAWLNGNFGLHANYSRGFRVPNVTDLGTLGLQGNGVFEAAVADLAGRNAIVGDRADDLAKSTGQPVERLRPEISDNIDFGARIRSARVQADLGGFWMWLDNSIISQTLLLPAGAVGQALGEQTINRQLASGAVFVPISTSPVLVRANFSGARMRGLEQQLRVRLTPAWSLRQNITYIYAEDSRTGLPPDIEPGIPPFTANVTLGYHPSARRFWLEPYLALAGRQDRLSSLALSDRRIGNPRSRANIQSFFNNGARVRGIVANNILVPTGETLAQVQNRVLGSAVSAPQFSAIPGFGIAGLRGGIRLNEFADLICDLANVADKNYRGIGWGVDGPGRNLTIKLRFRF